MSAALLARCRAVPLSLRAALQWQYNWTLFAVRWRTEDDGGQTVSMHIGGQARRCLHARRVAGEQRSVTCAHRT